MLFLTLPSFPAKRSCIPQPEIANTKLVPNISSYLRTIMFSYYNIVSSCGSGGGGCVSMSSVFYCEFLEGKGCTYLNYCIWNHRNHICCYLHKTGSAHRTWHQVNISEIYQSMFFILFERGGKDEHTLLLAESGSKSRVFTDYSLDMVPISKGKILNLFFSF